MYVNLNDLKHISKIISDIIKENRAKKLISYDIKKEMEKLYEPVIEPLKSIAEDKKIVTKAIEYNSQVNPITEQSETSSLQIENVHYDTLKFDIL